MAGNPTAEELSAPVKKKDEHRMVKSRYNGRPFWTCSACQYSTSREDSAMQHGRRPA